MMGWMKIPWDDIEKELEKRVEEVFLKVFDTMDDIENDLGELKENFPRLNETALAHEVIKDTAQRTALIGGGAALPDLIPALGWTAMIATLAGDFALTLREEMKMLLKFSFLFDPDCGLEQRKKDVITFLMFMARDKDKNAFAKSVLEEVEQLQLDVVSRKILIRVGVQLGLKFFRKKLVALIPGLGIALSGGVNYLGSKSMGRLGIEFFRNKAEFIREHGQSSSNIAVTNRATLQMMVNLAKMGEQIVEAHKASIRDQMEIFGFSKDESERILKELEAEDINPISIKDIRQMTEDDRRYVLKQGLKILSEKTTSKQENYLEFITRAFGLTQVDLKKIRDEVSAG